MTSKPPTPPGYTVSGHSISVMFVSGHQRVLGSHSAEQVLGWHLVMEHILAVFQSNHQLAKLSAELHLVLARWAEQGWMGRGRPVHTLVKVTEEQFFPPARQFGKMKQVKVMFFDQLTTSLRFYVRLKPEQQELSLKQLSLESLALRLENAEQADCVGIPVCLASLLREEIDSCWRNKHLGEVAKKSRMKTFSQAYSDKIHSWRAKTFS